MKILLYTDVHFNTYSSILRKRGDKFSKRLETLISSLNWIERIGEEQKVDLEICLGDFFDSPNLTAEELSALTEIKWNHIPKKFLVGNHESPNIDLSFNSTDALSKIGEIINKPTVERNLDTDLVYLPYIQEEQRKNLREYLPKQKNIKTIILSHNDIKNIQYGKFLSKVGFDLQEIESQSDLFINGHLHNGCFLNEKETILNLGNLCGQNFSENAFEYYHLACIIDTTTLELSFFENPCAYNFYKIDINSENDFKQLSDLKDNAVISFKCMDTLANRLKELLEVLPNIDSYKIIVVNTSITTQAMSTTFEKTDHLISFSNFIQEKLGTSDIVLEELNKVIGG